jgi:hypothetical protein
MSLLSRIRALLNNERAVFCLAYRNNYGGF